MIVIGLPCNHLSLSLLGSLCLVFLQLEQSVSVAKSVSSSLLEFCREAVERKLSKVVDACPETLFLGHAHLHTQPIFSCVYSTVQLVIMQ